MKPLIVLPEAEPEVETKHVLVTDDPELTLNASRFLGYKEEESAAKASADVVREEITPVALSRWLRANHGVEEPAASVLIPSPRGELLVSFAASWGGKPASVGIPAKHQTQEFDVQIAWDKVPGDKIQDTVNALQLLVKGLGLPKGCLKVSNTTVVAKSFAKARHQLPVEQNLEFERLGLKTKVSFKAR